MILLPILNTNIPVGGFGRRLTSTELKSLRKYGYTAHRNSIVVRYDNNCSSDGVIYYLNKNMYTNQRIRAITKY